MEIFKWEIQKIWRRTSTKTVIAVAAIYVIFSAVYNGVYNLGSNRNTPDGVSNIAKQYEYADSFGGTLTEEALVEVYEQIQFAYSPENMVEYEDGSKWISDEKWEEYVAPVKYPATLLVTLGRYDPKYNNIYNFKEIPRSFAENYYDIRENAAEQYISAQVKNESDRQFFLKKNAEVKTPFKYDWVEGQSIYLEIMPPVPIIAALIIAVFISPVYALEYQQKTDSVILCSKNGRGKLAAAKFCAGTVFSSAVYLLLIGLYVAGQIIFCGTRALDCPVQLINPLAAVPMTILRAEIYTIALGLLSCLAVTAATLLLSSVMRLVFPVSVSAMMTVIAPLLISEAVSENLGFINAVVPFMSDYTELFRTNIYFHIWSPYLMIAAPILIFIICAPFAVWKFRTHQTAK